MDSEIQTAANTHSKDDCEGKVTIVIRVLNQSKITLPDNVHFSWIIFALVNSHHKHWCIR